MATMIINPNIVTNYKLSSINSGNSDFSYFTDLFPYINSEYCLVGGQQSKIAWVLENSTIKYQNYNVYYTLTNEWIPLGSGKIIKRITFSYQKPYKNMAEYYMLSVDLSQISEDGSETTFSILNNSDEVFSTWRDVDIQCDFPANYLRIIAVNGQIYIKDITVYYEEIVTSNGGGATHIAKVTGQLKDLSSNLSDILMVSGGGGGGLLVGETEYIGKEAGGISGSGDNSADQTTGNAFGLGESGTNLSGGGSGLYGGYKGTSSKSGGAGSGYIGNSLLSNKKMVGYNVPTSSAEGTKTESVNEVSASAVSGKPKSGNGFARIKFLREIEGHIWSTSEQVVGTWINGEPLYEITFYKDSDFDYYSMNKFDALPENFERMVYARGYVQRDGNTEFDVFNTGDSGPVIQIKVNDGYFGAWVRGYAMISMAVTFRYTKSSN